MTPMTANDAVTKAVELELERRHMTRADLAREAGRARSWVTRHMSGERRWSVDDLDVLARGLGIPVHRLLRGGLTAEYLKALLALPIGNATPGRAAA